MQFVAFIVNPVAANGRGRKVWRRIRKACEEKKTVYRTYYTKYAGHAVKLAGQIVRLYPGKVKAIVAVGGDGTISEVWHGMQGSDIPLGVIPAGSGNDFARSLGLPTNMKKAITRLQKNHFQAQKQIDTAVAMMTGKKMKKKFVSCCGVGFDGEVAFFANRSKIKQKLNAVFLGGLIYPIMLVRRALTYGKTEAFVTVDGNRYDFSDVWFVAVLNMPYYGGGMKIAPHSRPDDGVLNVCVVSNMKRLRFLLLFVTVFFGRHVRLRGVTFLKGRTVKVETKTKKPIHIDGEPAGEDAVEITVLPRSLSVI